MNIHYFLNAPRILQFKKIPNGSARISVFENLAATLFSGHLSIKTTFEFRTFFLFQYEIYLKKSNLSMKVTFWFARNGQSLTRDFQKPRYTIVKSDWNNNMEHLCISGIVSVTSTFDSKSNKLISLWKVDDTLSYKKANKYAEVVQFLYIHIQGRETQIKTADLGFSVSVNGQEILLRDKS